MLRADGAAAAGRGAHAGALRGQPRLLEAAVRGEEGRDTEGQGGEVGAS